MEPHGNGLATPMKSHGNYVSSPHNNRTTWQLPFYPTQQWNCMASTSPLHTTMERHGNHFHTPHNNGTTWQRPFHSIQQWNHMASASPLHTRMEPHGNSLFTPTQQWNYIVFTSPLHATMERHCIQLTTSYNNETSSFSTPHIMEPHGNHFPTPHNNGTTRQRHFPLHPTMPPPCQPPLHSTQQ